ncbi:MAG: hypothetical protein WC356_04350 [Candidatus Micrarchaeia archaeon]|jgi:hypothetical protein
MGRLKENRIVSALSIQFTPADRALILKAAEMARMTMTTWARIKLVAAASRAVKMSSPKPEKHEETPAE